MTLLNLLDELYRRDIVVRMAGEQFQTLDFKKNLTPELKASIDHFTHTLAAYLRRADSSMSLPFSPLSFAQKRLWFFAQLTPDDTVTHILKFEARLLTPPNIPALKHALETVVQRHPSLRTTYRDLGGGTPVQQTRKELPPAFEVFDSAEWSRDQIGEKMRAITEQPVNLRKGPIVRCYLFALPRGRYIFKLLIPYLAADVWSLELLMDEISALYVGAKNGETVSLPPIASTYAEYIRWKLNMLAGEEGKQHRAYIDTVMAGDVPRLNLPFDRPRPSRQTFNTSSLFLTLTTTVTQQVKQFVKTEHISLHGLLMSAFFVLLHRYTDQLDILIGSPRSEQGHRRYQGVVGYFENPLPIRAKLAGNPPFRHFCRAMQQIIWEAFDHEEYPSHRLAHQYHLERDASHPPLFQAIFILQEPHQRRNISPFLLGQGGDRIELDGLIMQSVGFDDKARIFVDLQLTIFEEHGSLTALWQYNTDLFDEETIKRMGACFHILLQGILKDPERRIGELPILTDAQRQQILEEWNQTAVEYPKDTCLHQLFEEQVARAPEATALVFERQRLTYRELNARANQLARYLKDLGVGPETLVGIYIERSLEMVIGLLGILKAGGAYIPFDPEYPKERLAFMLHDSQVAILLTQAELMATLPEHQAQTVCLDADWDRMAQEQSDNLPCETNGDNLIYALYTSGSTGKPKGAMNVHKALVNRILWMQDAYQLTEQDRVLQKTPFSFDVSGWEFWWPLLTGATLVLAKPGGHKDATYIARIIQEQHITTIHFVPPMLHVFLEEPASEGCVSLRRVICSGEALPFELQEHFFKRLNAELHNLYGPTEAAIDVTCWECQQESSKKIVPIGKPIANTQIYLLDRYLQPVPVGVPAELHIGGINLARGYLNRPELTAEKFISNPFSLNPDEKLYKTGDLCRYLSDGNIEYLSRIDHQVKIRGLRIELGEIESAIAQYPMVGENLVLVREDTPGEKRLVSYIVPNQEYRFEAEEDSTEHISQWQNVYEETYHHAESYRDASFNITGWNSSYTGKPIPAEEMREWVDRGVERIRALAPRQVVEIGCGTGLLLFKIAPHCAQYWATDFSLMAIEALQRQLAKPEFEMAQVRLLQQTADDFTQIPAGAFDTVIINSVIQYFPNVEYLIHVIEQAVTAISPNRGAIFLGDLRSHPLLELFHTSVQFFQSPPALNAAQLRQRIHRQVSHENELTLDPELFFAIKARIPAITSVRIQPKRGSARNEMTRFRYDVTLFVNGDGFLAAKPLDSPPGRGKGWVAEDGQTLSITNPPLPLPGGEPHPQPLLGGDIRWHNWRAEGLTLPVLHQRLKETKPDALGVTDIPNARLFHELLMRDWLEDRETYASVEEARLALQEHSGETGGDPEEFWNFERTLPEYRIELSWARHGRDGAFDALFIRRDAADRVTLSFPEPEIAPKAWSAYANDPLRGKHLRTLIPRLRAHIVKKLPDYMVPAAFVLLDTLPLTPNGKVNRHALPAPERARPEVAAAYVAPIYELETVLVNLWEEMLDLERLGIHDDFFELGGDSLSMTRMLARLRQDLDVIVSLTDMFEVHTVAQLTEVVEHKMREEIEQLSDEEAAALLADAEQNEFAI